MAVDDTGDWGQPNFLASGAPEVDVDPSAVADYFAGITARRFATQAALISAGAPPSNGYLAQVTAIPGALFVRVAGAWVMYGVPRFADATARNAAITVPAAGMVTQLASELWPRRYNGTTWRPHGSGDFLIKPSSVTGTGATLSAEGATALATSGTVSISLNDIFSDDFDRYVLRGEGLMTAAALDIAVRMRVSGSDASGASDYDRLQVGVGGAIIAASSPSDASSGLIFSLGAAINEIAFEAEFVNPFKARRTAISAHARMFGTVADGTSKYEQEITHKQTTSYTGATLIFTGASSAFTGSLSVYGRAHGRV